jgi:hypothetical protein
MSRFKSGKERRKKVGEKNVRDDNLGRITCSRAARRSSFCDGPTPALADRDFRSVDRVTRNGGVKTTH